MRWFLFALICVLSSSSKADWVILKPVRPNTIGGALGDIDCHLPAGHIYQDSSQTTWAHETSHGIHSRIRKEFKTRNGYYLLKDKAFIIGSPNLTLADVAKNIPVDKRGRIYQLYLVDQTKWWNDTPFYILDELIAYINGCCAGLDYSMEKETVYSYHNALEMWEYVKVAQELSREKNFSEQKELDSFLDWVYNERLVWLSNEFDKKGWTH